LAGDRRYPDGSGRRSACNSRRRDFLSQLVVGRRYGGIYGHQQTGGVGVEPVSAIGSSPPNQWPEGLHPESIMNHVQIRRHERNPHLWVVSSQSGDDIAYITYPGNGYLAMPIGKWQSALADFLGKRFDTVEAAFEAVAHSFSEITESDLQRREQFVGPFDHHHVTRSAKYHSA
jgi:hypothetical protein